MSEHPMQPIEMDPGGVARFKQNAIIDYLFKSGRLDLNELATMEFSPGDRMQLAQQLGYSVSGYGDLSYASAESVERADKQVRALVWYRDHGIPVSGT